MVTKKLSAFKIGNVEVAETVRVLQQRGTSNIKIDKSREAQLPGKRISKTGNVYWETRKNRSDAPFKKV